MSKATREAIKMTIIAGLALATGNLLFAEAAVFTLTSGQILQTIVVGVATQIAVSYSRGLDSNSANFGSKIVRQDPIAPRQIVYGKTRVGGNVVFMDTTGTDNSELHLVVAIAGHEINSVEKIFVNDVELTSTTSTINSETVHTVTNTHFTNTENDYTTFGSGRLMRFTTELGADNQESNGYLVNNTSFTTDHDLKGIAYVYFHMIYDREKLGRLPQMQFEVKGKKLYDPRSTETAWTDSSGKDIGRNPALIARDILTDTRYGVKATTGTNGEINDSTDAGGFANAANACEVSITDGSGGTENKYVADGFSHMSTNQADILAGIMGSCAGKISYANGQFGMFVGVAQTPSLTITDDDLISELQIQNATAQGMVFNTVKAVYVNSANDYVSSDAPIRNAGTNPSGSGESYLATDTPTGGTQANFRQTFEMKLPFVTSQTQAQRLSKLALDYQRRTKMVTVSTSLKFLRVQPSDWVYLTNSRMGWTNKVFEVLSAKVDTTTEGSLFCSLQLKEIDSNVFAFVANDYIVGQADGSLGDSGGFTLGAPTLASDGLSEVVYNDNGTAKIALDVTWTNSSSAGIGATEIQWRLGGSFGTPTSVAEVSPDINTFRIPDMIAGQTVYVRVRHTNSTQLGTFSTTRSRTIAGDTTAPSVPTSLSVSTGLPQMRISWVNPSDTDLRSIKIYRRTANTDPTDDTYLVATVSGEPAKAMDVVQGASDGLSYNTTYYFWLRAVDFSGNQSNFTSSANGSFARIGDGDFQGSGGSTYRQSQAGNNNAPTDSAFNSSFGRLPRNNDVLVSTNTTNKESIAYKYSGQTSGSAGGGGSFSDLGFFLTGDLIGLEGEGVQDVISNTTTGNQGAITFNKHTQKMQTYGNYEADTDFLPTIDLYSQRKTGGQTSGGSGEGKSGSLTFSTNLWSSSSGNLAAEETIGGIYMDMNSRTEGFGNNSTNPSAKMLFKLIQAPVLSGNDYNNYTILELDRHNGSHLNSGLDIDPNITDHALKIDGTEVITSSRNLTNIGTIASGNITVTGSVTISADLTVSGTTTTIDTTNLDVKDKNITLNYGSGDTSSNADGAGITIQDAVDASTNATFTWNASDDNFELSHGLDFGDSAKIRLGTDNDLQIYHDGSNARIREITGELRLQTTSSGVNALVAKSNAAVELYHAGSKKLETSSSGIDVTGNVSLTGDVTISNAGPTLYLTDTDNNPDWQIKNGNGNLRFIDATNSVDVLTLTSSDVTIDAGGDIILDADGQDVIFKDGGTQFGSIRKNGNNIQLMASIEDGDITFHGDDGGSAITAMAIDMSAGGNVGIGTTSPTGKLNIVSGSSGSYLVNLDYNDGTDGGGFYQSGSTGLSLFLKNSSATQTVQIATAGDSYFNGGNVGIGTSSPTAKLHIHNTSTTSDGDGTADESPTGQDSILLYGHGGTNGQTYGGITWLGGSRRRAMISAVAENTDTDFVGLAFYTQGTDGSGDFNESMRIARDGDVGIGTQSPSFSAGSGLEISRAGPATLRLEDTDGTTGATELVQVDADGYLLTRQSSSALIFGINSSEKMRLASSGDVGIGTSSPDRLLTLQGDNSYMWMKDAGGGNVAFIGGDGANDGFIRLYNGSHSAKVEIQSDGDTYFNGGDVGIGSSSPEEKLHVSGNILLDDGDPRLYFQTGSSHYNWKIAAQDSTNKGFEISSGAADGDANSDTYTPRIVIEADTGDVGIGTTAPASPLHVETADDQIADFYSTDTDGYIRVRDSNDSLYVSSDNAVGSFGGNAGANANNINISLTSGAVGIGTTSPSSSLHVAKANAALGFDAGLWISSNPSDYTAGRGGGITFQNVDVYTAGIYGLRETSSWEGALAFYTHTDGSGNTFGSTFTEKMRLTNEGRLGLGTTSPSYKLHLDAASDGINISGSSAFVRWNSGDMQIRNAGSYSMAFDTYDGSALTEKMTIDTQGNVKVSKGGISYDGEGKIYSWRAQNNAGNASNYTKIASVSGSHSTRFYINLYGRSQGYSDGVLGAMATIVGQINNDNNIDLMYYNFFADDDAINGAGHVDTGSCTADIYVQTGTYSELVAQGGISDGTLTPYGDKTGSSAPTGHVAASSRVVLVQNASGQVGINDISPSDTLDVNGSVSLKNTSATATNYIHMPRGGGITFYGDANQHHGIFSRNLVNTAADDILISSYGSIYFDLDSNSNNSSSADFVVGRHNSNGGNRLNLNGEDGDLIVAGNMTAYGSASDLRLKENIVTIENPLDKVSQLRGVTFNYKEDGSKSTGLIAQELEKVLPEVVYETEDINDADDKFKAVRYGNVVGLLVEAIKELKAEVEELKKIKNA